ncbi:MAG: serine/threonine protein kinase [Muribaculaceae bacterium]|nr:serine/threonine protein kinase [Muribaculaceae bacterium]
MNLKVNRLFANRYRLIKRLGHGATSQVWLAQDTAIDGMLVAIKAMSAYSNDVAGMQAFMHQFKLVYNVQHQNLLVPTNYDVFDGTPYLVLPYCENGSVAGMVGRSEEEDVIKFLHDVSAGLEYLHAHDIIHQDIKPDNVLLDDDCNFLVADFDISVGAAGYSDSDLCGGTRAYMSPERFNKNFIGEKESDIWAVAATAYEMIAGDAPFGDNGGLAQAQGAQLEPLPKTIHSELSDLIYKSLSADPQDRPTAGQIRKATAYYLENGNWKRNPYKLAVKGLRYATWGITAVVISACVAGGLYWLLGDANWAEPKEEYMAEAETADLVTPTVTAPDMIQDAPEFFSAPASPSETDVSDNLEAPAESELETAEEGTLTSIGKKGAEITEADEIDESVAAPKATEETLTPIQAVVANEDNPNVYGESTECINTVEFIKKNGAYITVAEDAGLNWDQLRKKITKITGIEFTVEILRDLNKNTKAFRDGRFVLGRAISVPNTGRTMKSCGYYVVQSQDRSYGMIVKNINAILGTAFDVQLIQAKNQSMMKKFNSDHSRFVVGVTKIYIY